MYHLLYKEIGNSIYRTMYYLKSKPDCFHGSRISFVMIYRITLFVCLFFVFDESVLCIYGNECAVD